MIILFFNFLGIIFSIKFLKLILQSICSIFTVFDLRKDLIHFLTQNCTYSQARDYFKKKKKWFLFVVVLNQQFEFALLGDCWKSLLREIKSNHHIIQLHSSIHGWSGYCIGTLKINCWVCAAYFLHDWNESQDCCLWIYLQSQCIPSQWMEHSWFYYHSHWIHSLFHRFRCESKFH